MKRLEAKTAANDSYPFNKKWFREWCEANYQDRCGYCCRQLHQRFKKTELSDKILSSVWNINRSDEEVIDWSNQNPGFEVERRMAELGAAERRLRRMCKPTPEYAHSPCQQHQYSLISRRTSGTCSGAALISCRQMMSG
jgi:hypothetical protein